MDMQELVLVGAGGHAQACIDVIETEGRFRIAGLVGAPHEVNSSILGYPIFATDEDLPALAGRYRYVLICVGQIRTPIIRIKLYETAINLGFSLPTIISPHAVVSAHAMLGNGTVVMHGAIVNAGAKVGCNCIVNSRALIEHGAELGDHCHISTGAILNGASRVGSGCFLGSHCTVRESVTIGASCIVGMGQLVRHDLLDHAQLIASEKK